MEWPTHLPLEGGGGVSIAIGHGIDYSYLGLGITYSQPF